MTAPTPASHRVDSDRGLSPSLLVKCVFTFSPGLLEYPTVYFRNSSASTAYSPILPVKHVAILPLK